MPSPAPAPWHTCSKPSIGRSPQSATRPVGQRRCETGPRPFWRQKRPASCSVANLHPLLEHALGSDLHVNYDCAKNLWPICADPHQLENAIINLAVNARDAVDANHGKIRIKTRNVVLPRKGKDSNQLEYVAITVKDNGKGMSPDVQAKVFEPFFTTKPAGKGSGLGLCQVYGFVTQSGGIMEVLSRVGKGTEVKLYFPRLPDDAAASAA
jgi:signal transduction histidine kinase